jgi:ubiquinone biosynthesis protein
VSSRLGISSNVWLFRLLIDSPARRVFSSRYAGHEDALLDQVWADAAERWATIPAQSTLGATLTVRLATVTAAAYAILIAQDGSVQDATQTVHDIAWGVYNKMGSAAWFVSGVISRNTAERLRIATVAFRTFPFSSPSYEWQTVTGPAEVVAFNCLRCPVATYFKEQNLSELCVRTWCALDFPLATGVWNSRLERSGSIAGGTELCDFRWYAHGSDKPNCDDV